MQIHAYHIVRANGWCTGTGPRPTHCAECGDTLHGSGIGTGYGIDPNEADVTGAFAADVLGGEAYRLKKGERVTMSRAICYDCCGRDDVAGMKATGRATLYVTRRSDATMAAEDVGMASHGKIDHEHRRYKVSNWPGSFVVYAGGVSKQARGIQRTEVWFTGPDGARWHGVNRGDNQLLRCKRLKGTK
jgi:hypothetical protein